jgi:tripartite-type tricarboxylate transporter receptor subunit TctC
MDKPRVGRDCRAPLPTILVAVIGAFIGMASAIAAAAEDYPVRPIRLVVPFPAGGPTDLVGRMIGQKMAERLGQAVVVDNRAGAGGTIGSEIVAKAPADGYTLLYGSTSTLAISGALYKALPYDPATAFAPISLVSSGAQTLVTHPGLPVATVADLIAHARANPGRLNYGSAGNGTPVHLAGELFRSVAGIEVVHVPFKGGAPALAALLAREVDYVFDVVPTTMPHAEAGSLKVLAVTSAARTPVLPGVPTVAESGLPGFVATFWSGLVAPAGTPAPVIARLNAAIVAAIASPDLRETLLKMGAEPAGTTPGAFAAFITAEAAKWQWVAERSGARLD